MVIFNCYLTNYFLGFRVTGIHPYDGDWMNKPSNKEKMQTSIHMRQDLDKEDKLDLILKTFSMVSQITSMSHLDLEVNTTKLHKPVDLGVMGTLPMEISQREYDVTKSQNEKDSKRKRDKFEGTESKLLNSEVRLNTLKNRQPASQEEILIEEENLTSNKKTKLNHEDTTNLIQPQISIPKVPHTMQRSITLNSQNSLNIDQPPTPLILSLKSQNSMTITQPLSIPGGPNTRQRARLMSQDSMIIDQPSISTPKPSNPRQVIIYFISIFNLI
jgi:hypothetical protein